MTGSIVSSCDMCQLVVAEGRLIDKPIIKHKQANFA